MFYQRLRFIDTKALRGCISVVVSRLATLGDFQVDRNLGR